VPQLTLHAGIAASALVLRVLLRRAFAPILIPRIVHECFLLFLHYGSLDTDGGLVLATALFCTVKHGNRNAWAGECMDRSWSSIEQPHWIEDMGSGTTLNFSP
jgi:hypothetical protein